MQKNNFLSVKDLVVEYTSGKDVIHAVNNVSLELEEGKTLGLVGETGAGKTTIAKSILRILPDPPAKIKSGTITFEGEELLSLPEEAMRHLRGNKIAMIFQDPMTALNPLMTVGAQIGEVIALHHPDWSSEQMEKQVGEMLELVGIPAERKCEYPHQFSGGMKQRVVIAIALSCNPKLLLADEPTTALDVTIQAQVLDLIKSLQEKYKMSMILITHDLGVVAENCDMVATVYAGKIVEYGTIRDVYKNTLHPYTKGLFDSLPNSSTERRLKCIKGMPPDPSKEIEGCVFAPRCPSATGKCKHNPIEMIEVTPGHYCRCCNLHGEEIK